MNRNEYNGWANYETWCVNLWMSNDAGSDQFYREIAQEAYNDAKEKKRADGTVFFSREDVAIRAVADRFTDEYEERQSELTGVTGVFSDLLSAALSEVDWHEIAEHYIDDMEKSEDNSPESEAN